MTDMPWFKFYHQDWLAGTTGLSMAERGCYITLLALMYDAGGSIVRDDNRLARRCGCPTPNFRSALQALIDDGKIVQDGDRLTNDRVNREVMARENIGAMAREKAKSRWDKNKEKQQSENAAAMPQQCKSEVRSQNTDISTSVDINAREARSLAVRAAFDAFWRRWPHKVGKPAAEKAFAKCSGEIEAILLGIDSYIRDKPPDRPWLNPATFLNQRRWEDAPAGISSSPSQKGGFASLLAKSMGMKNGQSRRDPDEAVHVLPLDYRGERGDSRDDDRGVSGDVIDLLAVRSG